MTRKKTQEEFENEVFEKFGDSITILGEYITNQTPILVRFNDCGHEKYIRPSKLMAGQKCGVPECKNRRISKTKTKNTEQYKQDLINKGIDYIEVLGEYTGVKNKIKVKNTKCGHIYEADAGNILQGSGCPKCFGYRNLEQYIEELNKKYPNEYEILGEYKGSHTPILTKHKCGCVWEVAPHDLLAKRICPKCNMSRGEYYIYRYLIKNNVEFEQQYKIDDCKRKQPLPFDFMVKIGGEIKLIEFDGSQHYLDIENKYWRPSVVWNDLTKDTYCALHSIPLLRIPYWWLRTNRIEKELDKFIFNK